MQRLSLLTSSDNVMFFANMKIGVCIREYIVKKFHRKVRTMI
jgi:hypothetical protein